ncbi:Uncharacterised protein [Acholeplasma oculi]|uniref:Alcohol acetyltransferase n=1 Tax=Acholeplasma oculi TaxID=35623 RepID=A0A061ACL5_9MOLU|nr:hypothetical protein [Acholeplasma oculi]CDR31154.1 Alcohol acetyltransferase [Acholeplasma oculi]SKC37549.1 Uncharacterized protein, contains a NRPS condensation (elongation) domain [Acholeplasma oculi]SUT90970.1 Uncharacterised protein [Acholeplasma oculi]
MAKLRKFYDLDNAAKIFPVVANESRSYMFRLSIVFKELIDPELLKIALVKTTRRFKHLNVRIRKGLFWYYFEENLKEPFPMLENGLINPYLYFKENNDFLFRTLYYKERLSVEFFHALTDGKGALEFINSLAYEYLTLKGYNIDPEDLVIRADAAGSYQEVEDEFKKLYHKQKITSTKEPKAYHLTGTYYANHYNAVMNAYIDVENIKAVAKNFGATISEYLVAVSILAIKRSGGQKQYKHLLRVFIPVNMRQFYPSITLRNFASFVRVNYDLNQQEQELKDIIMLVKSEMKKELDPDLMLNRIIQNVRYEQNPFLRLTPLFVKILAMRSVYGMIGEALNSFDISNLGQVILPKDMQPFISHYQFTIATSNDTPKALSVVTYNGTLTLSFISKMIERDFEKAFFEILGEHQIKSYIESNNWEVI